MAKKISTLFLNRGDAGICAQRKRGCSREGETEDAVEERIIIFFKSFGKKKEELEWEAEVM